MRAKVNNIAVNFIDVNEENLAISTEGQRSASILQGTFGVNFSGKKDKGKDMLENFGDLVRLRVKEQSAHITVQTQKDQEMENLFETR